jgi:hypothetical protein
MIIYSNATKKKGVDVYTVSLNLLRSAKSLGVVIILNVA